MPFYLCVEKAPHFKRVHRENQVVKLCFCEPYDKSALQGRYLAGRVPAADRSGTWRCQHMEIWIPLSHNGKYISICLGDEGNNCLLSNITSPRTANSALRLLLKCPVCFLSLSSEKDWWHINYAFSRAEIRKMCLKMRMEWCEPNRITTRFKHIYQCSL